MYITVETRYKKPRGSLSFIYLFFHSSGVEGGGGGGPPCSKFGLLALFCISLEQPNRILFKPHHIILTMHVIYNV